EVGTGSGVISQSIIGITPHLLAIDINPHSVQYVSSKGIPTIRGNLLDPIRSKFDLILFNAPYLPTQKEEKLNDWLELALDGGVTGREVIERFLPDAKDHLSPYGRILLLVSSLTGLPEITLLCKKNGLICIIVDSEVMEDGEILYVLHISKDFCSLKLKNVKNQ
ncbi:MAG TPA: methylase, partial [Methanocorpusculum sp.]|nr:methylase [Methanocorpusculum sp.]